MKPKVFEDTYILFSGWWLYGCCWWCLNGKYIPSTWNEVQGSQSRQNYLILKSKFLGRIALFVRFGKLLRKNAISKCETVMVHTYFSKADT